MPTSFWGKRAVPLGLGVAMLATLVAAALSPNIGIVSAQTNCQYSSCTSGTSTPFPWWIVGVIAIIIVGLLAAYLIFGRRRPPSKGAAAPQAWEPPAGAAAGGAAGAGAPSGPSTPSDSGASASYIETPEDVGAVLPGAAGAAGAAGGAAAAGTGAAATEEEPDIDSLMAELDKISGEILKKAPKKGSPKGPDADAADDAAGK